MIRRLELQAGSVVRLWERTSPTASGPYEGIAVEAAIPCGAMCMYGLLGATKRAGRAPLDCSVTVPESAIAWPGSLVEEIDVVHIGLAEWLRDPVLEQGQPCLETAGASFGLDFDRACTGQVGSNALIFQRLTRVLVDLHLDPSILDDTAKVAVLLSAALLETPK